MTPTRLRTRTATVAALIVAGTALLPATPAGASSADDELVQTIDPDQSQGSGRVVIDRGHVDFGPTLNTGEWIVQIHDDTGTPKYWRNPEDVVMKVNDTGKLTVPDDDAYTFLQESPGTEVWVVPQTRNADVVWTGWNTQEPTVLESLNLGTTLRIHGVDGPGDVSVYLQSGNFGDPQPLWSTFDAFPQETWIEVNTHTHANWVFTEPGVYTLDVTMLADLADGTHVEDPGVLRFAVGTETDPQTAFPAATEEPQQEETSAAGAEAPHDATDTETPSPSASTDEESTSTANVAPWVSLAALVLVVAVVTSVLLGRRARARADAEAEARDDDTESSGRRSDVDGTGPGASPGPMPSDPAGGQS